MTNLFPAYGQALESLEHKIQGEQQALNTSSEATAALAEFLEEKIADLEEMKAQLQQAKDSLSEGLPASGNYSLYLPPAVGGVARIQAALFESPNAPPDDLNFSALVCLVGGGPDLEALASLLGL